MTPEELEEVRKRVRRQMELANAGASVSSALDMATGIKSDPSGYERSIRMGEQEMGDAEQAVAAARQRALDLYSQERDKSADIRQARKDEEERQRRYEEAIRREAEGRRIAERQAAEDQRTSQSFPLELEHKRAQIEALRRGPKGEDPLVRRKRELEVKKLEAELSGDAPVDKKEALQVRKLEMDVSGEDPKKVAQAESALKRLRGLTSELRALHDKYGTEFGGAAGTQMRQLVTAIQIEGKTLAELGALSGPDLELMQSLAGYDPTSVGSNLKGLFGYDQTDPALDQLEKWAQNAADAAKSIYGPKGTGPQTTPPGAARPVRETPTSRASEGTVRVRRKSDGVTKEMSPQQAQRFNSDPNYEIF